MHSSGIQFTVNLFISGYSDRHINGLILKYTAIMYTAIMLILFVYCTVCCCY